MSLTEYVRFQLIQKCVVFCYLSRNTSIDDTHEVKITCSANTALLSIVEMIKNAFKMCKVKTDLVQKCKISHSDWLQSMTKIFGSDDKSSMNLKKR